MTRLPLALLLALSIAASAPSHPRSEGTSSCSGVIDWKIADRRTGRLIGKGRTHVAKEDVRVERVPDEDGGVFYDEHLDLDAHFEMGISNFPEAKESDLSGFGMWFRRTDLRTFSWEWFVIMPGHEARKLQGQGEIFVEVGPTSSGWQVTRTRFLSDALFRTCIFGSPGCRTRWTLTIFKGSCVDW